MQHFCCRNVLPHTAPLAEVLPHSRRQALPPWFVLLRLCDQARNRLKSGCLILVNKEHLLPVGTLRIPPYFLSTLGFLIQFITVLEEMGTNREPFPKKSCFQNVTHRGVGLISSLMYCSPNGIYRDLLTHPQSPHTDQTRSWVWGVPMWLQPKQVPNSLTRQPDVIKKTSRKGQGSRERTNL